jgi:hypothetical protein
LRQFAARPTLEMLENAAAALGGDGARRQPDVRMFVSTKSASEVPR